MARDLTTQEAPLQATFVGYEGSPQPVFVRTGPYIPLRAKVIAVVSVAGCALFVLRAVIYLITGDDILR